MQSVATGDGRTNTGTPKSMLDASGHHHWAVMDLKANQNIAD